MTMIWVGIGEFAAALIFALLCSMIVNALFRKLNEAMICELGLETGGPAVVFVIAFWAGRKYIKKRKLGKSEKAENGK